MQSRHTYTSASSMRIPLRYDPATAEFTPALDLVTDLPPGARVEPDYANPDVKLETRYEQPGNVPRLRLTMAGRAVRNY